MTRNKIIIAVIVILGAGKRPPPLTLHCQIIADRASEDKTLTLADLQSCGKVPQF